MLATWGLLVFLTVLLIAMNHAIFLYNKGYRAGLVYIGFLVYFILSGALESTFGNHFRAYTVILMLMVTGIFAFRSEYDRIAALTEE